MAPIEGEGNLEFVRGGSGKRQGAGHGTKVRVFEVVFHHLTGGGETRQEVEFLLYKGVAEAHQAPQGVAGPRHEGGLRPRWPVAPPLLGGGGGNVA